MAMNNHNPNSESTQLKFDYIVFNSDGDDAWLTFVFDVVDAEPLTPSKQRIDVPMPYELAQTFWEAYVSWSREKRRLERQNEGGAK